MTTLPASASAGRCRPHRRLPPSPAPCFEGLNYDDFAGMMDDEGKNYDDEGCDGENYDDFASMMEDHAGRAGSVMPRGPSQRPPTHFGLRELQAVTNGS